MAWQHFGIDAWPTVVLIDGQGQIRGRIVGDTPVRDLEAAIAFYVEVFGASELFRLGPLDADAIPRDAAGRGRPYTGVSDGDPRDPFVEYAPFDVRDDSVRATVSEIVVDMTLSGNATVTLKARESPKGNETTKTVTITPTTARATTRISGAQIGFKIDFDGDTFSRLSSLRGNVAEAGTR